MNLMKAKAKTKNIEDIPNSELLYQIQPEGGIDFSDGKIIKLGVGYMACLHIYDYPKSQLSDNWLNSIMNIKNTIVTMDVKTEKTEVVQENLNKAVTEQSNRIASQKKSTEKREAAKKKARLEQKFEEIREFRRVGKLIDIRIFVVAKTIPELDATISEIKRKRLGGGYKASVFLNESKYEYQSMFLSQKEQDTLINAREGQILTSDQLAASYPFNFSKLSDEFGTYFGLTNLGGAVLLDIFLNDDVRRHYNFLASGIMGAGKSTILKKIVEDRFLRGDNVKIIDPMGEFSELVRYYGGKVIEFRPDEIIEDEDGNKQIKKGSILNPLEIQQADDNDGVNLLRHLNQVKIFYKLATNSENEAAEADLFVTQLKKFYIDIGLIPKNEDFINHPITGRNPEEYPILEDFLKYLKNKLYFINDEGEQTINPQLSLNAQDNLDKIITKLESLITVNGTIFNGYSTFSDISNEKLVSFDVSGLKDLGNIFNAELFNIIFLASDSAKKVGKKMKYLYEHGKISKEDIVHNLILIDEAHNVINANLPDIVDLIIAEAREGRKNFTGIGLSSQSINDFVPESSLSKNQEKIKVLFQLMQYKFILQQDPSTFELLQSTFKNEITNSEIKHIGKFKRGQCLLVINGMQNIEFKVYLPQNKRVLYGGGA